MNLPRKRIAIIGSGISGLASAYFLNRKHDVVLFDELGVGSIASDMSFGMSMDGGALEWAGSSLDTVFAQRVNAGSPSFLRMLCDILHFNRNAERFLQWSNQTALTLGQLLQQESDGARFRDAYLLPMAAAIGSSSPSDILQFPAATFLRFCLNHGLLQVNDRRQWRTVAGGACHYVNKIAATLPDVRLNTPVDSVRRSAGGMQVWSSSAGANEVDAAVFTPHAPTTLAMSHDASQTERVILGAYATSPTRRPSPGRTPRLRPRLRRNAAPLGCSLPPAPCADRGPGLR